jgi:CarD family transcriptional regulator
MHYGKGDIVLYGLNGACRIKAIESREQGAYYILTPVHKDRTTLMVPAGNEALVARMRPVPPAEEVEASICKALQTTPTWIDDNAERKEHAKNVLANGNEFDLLMLSRSFHQHKEYVLARGKKAATSDTTILRSVQDRIRDEFSLVFDINPEDVDAFIAKHAQG